MLSGSNIVLMPREKLLKYGVGSLSDEELLAIFLRTGIKGISVLNLAGQLLDHFGSIHVLLSASPDELSAIKGLGQAKSIQFIAISEMFSRSIASELRGTPSFTDPGLVRRYLLFHFEQTDYERFACLFLDSKNRLIHFDFLFNGSIDQAQIYPRTVAQLCLKHNAAAVIFAHNHPSGDATPSQSDRTLTQRLIKTLALVDVKVLDHFVLGNDKCLSMAELQML